MRINPRDLGRLALTGLFYNLGVWVDKFIFWGDPLTATGRHRLPGFARTRSVA